MINNYIGIPYKQGGFSLKGADCWGLVLMVLNDVYKHKINVFRGAKFTGQTLSDSICGETRKRNWNKVLTRKGGDVAVMTERGKTQPSHIGIVVDDKRILHSLENSANGASSVHSVAFLTRVFNKIEFYRWQP